MKSEEAYKIIKSRIDQIQDEELRNALECILINQNYGAGTEFESEVRSMIYAQNNRYPLSIMKPDFYDPDSNTLIECKHTRPYYTTYQKLEGDDIGTGLPRLQYERYCKAHDKGIKVKFVHKLTEGRNAGKVYITDLDEQLKLSATPSRDNKTVYWRYEYLGSATLKL